MTESKEDSAKWERHFQSIVMALMVPFMAWLAWANMGTQVRLAALTERVNFGVNDRYTKSEAVGVNNLNDERYNGLKRRVERIEKTLDDDP